MTSSGFHVAAQMGAEWLSGSVQMTQDGGLVLRHELELSLTTNVAEQPAFARRRRTKAVGDATLDGWFAEDFTVAELRLLRTRERRPHRHPRSARRSGEALVTVEELLTLQRSAEWALGRPRGVVLELRHPAAQRAAGHDVERALVDLLRRHGLNEPRGRVMVQSTEPSSLARLRTELGLKTQAIQALGASGERPGDDPGVTYGDLATRDGLGAIRRHADAVAPARSLVVPVRPDGSSGLPTAFVSDAHAWGLEVYPRTFRGAPERMRRELARHLALGADGVVTDRPDIAVEAVGRHRAS